MSTFLDDLNAEIHDDLLQNGNLRRTKTKAEQAIKGSSWTGEHQWQSQGYCARVLRQHCVCGNTLSLLQGVFHVETSPRGTRKEEALDLTRFQVSLDGNYPIAVTEQMVKVCAECITTKGFTHG